MADQQASVGRIVHFYDHGLRGAHMKRTLGGAADLNGQGEGPYPALVLQVMGPEGQYVNLLVHGWGGDWREGMVEQKSGDSTLLRYWEFPPRV